MASYILNQPDVSGEVIDGEAIIMHLRRGHYFSTEGSGALLWAGIENGAPSGLLIASLETHYGLDRDTARDAVETFLATLNAHDLLRPGGGDGDVPEAAAHGIGTDYAPPHLNIYTDMQDLLLLDPIHDADAGGWPIAPPAAAPVD